MFYKFCKCGCGNLTSFCKVNDKTRGYIKNMPNDYVYGHNWKNKKKNHMSDYTKNLLRLSQLGRIPSAEARQKMSLNLKKRWQNPIYVKNLLKKLYKRPTQLEKDFSKFLHSSFPNEWKYSGDGSFLIGIKNPDFIHLSKLKCIEVFYSYYKIRDFDSIENYISRRGNYFKQFGWDSLFFTKDGFYNQQNLVAEKIKTFMEVF